MTQGPRAAGQRREAGAVFGVRRRALVIVTLALALLFGVAPLAQPAVQAAAPRVAIIVGPVAGLTAEYRAEAERAAAEARRWTDDVVTVYSPNATWSAARSAMTGASIVLYLGHGNGFPSRYSRTLNPKTQNGLGLNPVAGQGDGTHQYFGEAYVARQVRLAPNAVVVLARLCYASGNSEPGLPEGSLDTARRRVDNFAAGFVAAGAGAVIADAYLAPAYYVRSILAGRGTIEQIWRGAPNFHGNVIAFESERSPGLTALLDPTRPRSQFYRSLVTRAQLRADEVARGAAFRGDMTGPVAVTSAPRVGPTVTKVALRGRPVAGSEVELALSFSDPGTEPPADLQVGLRWTPLELRPEAPPEPAPSPAEGVDPPAQPSPEAAAATDAGADEAAMEPPAAFADPAPTPAVAEAEAASALDANPGPDGDQSAEPAAPAEPADRASPEPVPLPAPAALPILMSPPATPDPAAATPAPEPPADPAAGLVAAEAPGAVVMLAPTRATAKGARVTLAVPDRPGLYRLAATIHDRDGVAFDAATQERVPALIVRVTADLSARVAVAGWAAATAGEPLELPVAVLNSGTLPWAETAVPTAVDYEAGPATMTAPPPAFVVGHWLRIDPPDGAAPAEVVRERVLAAPGETARATLRLVAPGLPGTYLLVLDVVSPLHGSLVAAGDEPAVVRVTVAERPTDPIRDVLPMPDLVPAPALDPGEPAPAPTRPAKAAPPGL